MRIKFALREIHIIEIIVPFSCLQFIPVLITVKKSSLILAIYLIPNNMMHCEKEAWTVFYFIMCVIKIFPYPFIYLN